ncbi:ATP-binding protein [Kutzneria sp. CA-103260]|uniref:ATP-binding protein n=1 Tax=Kutzneria sp. CA-103260 TaxID=2802641 RepID=UPI001BA7A1D2|nr:LuxR family transcriptional regulator [Kutzneria sp. CA-103260]QUQ72386.1 LuxR family transcriptional regulator [Kutzneria sp. CA-103260]
MTEQQAAATGRSAGPLVGRARELGHVSEFFAADADNSRALVVFGDAGIGKSALLAAAAEDAAAAGALVLWASGGQFEAGLGFAALNQALVPVLDAVDGLSDVHRQALEVALGCRSGATPAPLVISTAALALLRLLSARQPVLLVVDDMQWIDRASATVLGFVARRIRGSRIGLLAAARADHDIALKHCGLAEFELSRLDEDSANLLLASRFPQLAPRVRRRLLAEARGNPLALLELPTTLSAPQAAAQEALPALLPLSHRLQALFGARIAALPARSRQILLLAALDATGRLGVLETATGWDLADLPAAEAEGLVRIEEFRRRVEFRHPLIRAAVIDMSTTAERRRAHRALADAVDADPERRAWHLAEASEQPDADVAAALEQAAHQALVRGDGTGAIALLTRAAELSPPAVDKSRRLAEAAHIGAQVTGDLATAAKLLADARRLDPDGTQSLRAAVTTVYLMINTDCTMETACRLLLDAIAGGAHGYDANDPALLAALGALQEFCWYSGKPELWDAYLAVAGRVRPGLPGVLGLALKTYPDPARTAHTALDDVDPIIEAAHHDGDLSRVTSIAYAVTPLDRVGDLREPLWRVVRQSREHGPIRRHIGALSYLCRENFLTGLWDEAAQLADEGLDACEVAGFQFSAWLFHHTHMLLAGARGDAETAAALFDDIVGWATPRGVGLAISFAQHARTISLLGSGDYEGAYQAATAITPSGQLPRNHPYAVRHPFDLVEAAVRAGHHAEASAHVEALHRNEIARLSPRLALLVGGASAMCAEDDNRAFSLFEAALAVPGTGKWRFEYARIQLAYGERLRRARAVAASRAPLRDAEATFDQLGAKPWALRATQELRAAGQATVLPASAPLTAQELEIAQLAASGLSNKQIAERVFVSHRTVGAHLYRIFPKLGITARAGLRDALSLLEGSRARKP